MKTLPVSFRFSPETKAALEAAARKDDRSVSSLVERILREWLTRRGFMAKVPKDDAAPKD